MKAKPSKHSGEVILEVGRRDESLLAASATAPFRINSILVPVDFSECASKALRYAIPFAIQHHASVTLLHVIASPPPPYNTGELGALDYAVIDSDMRSAAEEKLKALAEKELAGGTENQWVVRTGSASAEIVALARSMPADLIVISTHGRTGLKHVLLGSVAEDVVRRAPCPVLVVREREHDFLGG
jgi:universal stress protein A